VGLGTWAWGSRYVWNYGKTHGRSEVEAALRRSIEMGVNWVDTAEVYGNGASERIIGELLKDTREEVLVATKFFPLRATPWAARRAAEHSLRRLGVDAIDLYQVHWPNPLHPVGATMRTMERLVRDGKVRHIGVSNFGPKRLAAAREALSREDVVTDQVHYNLLQRKPETSGLVEYARREGVSIIAYSPLAQGVLTDKYGPGRHPGGLRRFMPKFRDRNLRCVAPLVGVLRANGEARGATTSQVALAWLLKDPNVVVIPGAKNGEQAVMNSALGGLALSDDEVARIERAAAECV
jgi:aryl-alcohol dehydrogenase-like predicted oxidoreductase